MIFQILVITYAAWTILVSASARKRRAISSRYFLLVAAAHAAIIFVTIFPNATYPLAHLFGIGRGADFIIYCAIIVLTRILFHLYHQNRRLESQLTQIARHLALKEKEK